MMERRRQNSALIIQTPSLKGKSDAAGFYFISFRKMVNEEIL
jgi:hypothetical protein